MPAQMKIKTRCPMCKTAYQVPHSSVGHRARCPKCDSVFRVVVPPIQQSEAESPHAPETAPTAATATVSRPSSTNTSRRPADSASHRGPEPSPRQTADKPLRPRRDHASGHPTEEDIVGWLMEGAETDDLPPEPRWWQAPPAEAPEPHPTDHPAQRVSA